MKAKLLKKLRKEIFDNTDIAFISRYSLYITTRLNGEFYVGPRATTLAIYTRSEELKREIEHIALQGYIESKRKQIRKNDNGTE